MPGRATISSHPLVLRMLQRMTTGGSSAPLCQSREGPRAAWLPVVTLSLNQTHALADGVPVNGAFRPSDLPYDEPEPGRWRAVVVRQLAVRPAPQQSAGQPAVGYGERPTS